MATADAAMEHSSVTTRTTPIRVWLTLLKHHLRLLAPSSIAWIIGLALTPALVVGVYEDTFPTMQERVALAQSIEGNPAFEAMFGKAIGLETIEGFTMWRAGGPLIPAIIIWGALAATRLARQEEDKGHDELLLGGVLSRGALLLSALAALTIVIGIYTLLAGLILPAVSTISTGGSWRFAFAMSGGFIFFAALGAFLAQITPSRSSALRIALGVIGASFGLRVLSVTEQMPDWLPWITPFGWFAEVGPPGAGSNVPFVLFGIGALAFAVAAVVLNGRREIHGSMLLAERETVEVTRPHTSLWVHEARLDLPSVIGFASIGLLLTTIFGMVSGDFREFIEDFPAFAQFLTEFGLQDPTDPSAFIGMIISVLVLVVTLYAAAHISSIRENEASGRLAVLLILPLERHRWILVNTAVGLAGVVVISLAIGLGAMLGTAITGTMLAPYDALRAGLNLIPIAVLFMGLGLLVFGLYPSLTGPIVYVVMLSTFIMVLLDAFLDIPAWLVALSPFEHLALVPGEDANLGVSGLYLLIGVAGAALGTYLFRRRDLMMD